MSPICSQQAVMALQTRPRLGQGLITALQRVQDISMGSDMSGGLARSAGGRISTGGGGEGQQRPQPANSATQNRMARTTSQPHRL